MNAIQRIAPQRYTQIGRRLLFACGVAALATGAGAPAQAQTNLALGKPAQQSSQSPWSTGPNDAQGGVDGVKNGRFGFHTNPEPGAWWKVDLQQASTLGEIRVYNRMDAPARAYSLQILLSNDGANWQLVHSQNGTPFGGTDGKPLSVNVNGRQARYVKLQLAGTEYLHLDEVEVYAGSTTGGEQPTTATGSFHGMWATNWGGVYLGIVQTGNQVTGYVWLDDWYQIFTGTVRGRTLEARWDAYFVGGTATGTLAPDNRGFDLLVRLADGTAIGTIQAGWYAPW